MKRNLLISAILLVGIVQLNAQKVYQPNWESIDSRPVPEWFENAKFGIFIHWGLYSVPSWGPIGQYSEWYWNKQNPEGKPAADFSEFHNATYGKDFKYQDFVSAFKAEMFNPDKWAEIFKNSGAKYIVLTSKHHEGFTLWPSEHSWNWNSVDVGPHRDLCGDLTNAVKAQGLHMGFYYSLYEWYNPLYKSDVKRYVEEHMIPQMKDLVNRYEPDLVWTDGEWGQTSDVWESTRFLSWLFNESLVKNTVAVNDRWGKETRGKHGGFYTTEYDLVHSDKSTSKIFSKPWEECRGIGGSFGYNRNENLEDYSSSEQLVHILINKVARGGNLLLNVGPTADGRIPVIMQQRLADIGEWLNVNGEAIYSTRLWEEAPAVTPETTVYYTRKGSDLYVFVTKWQNQPIEVPTISKTGGVSLLGYNGRVKYSVSGKRLKIIPPVLTPSDNPCDYAWVFKLKDAVQ